MLIHDSELLIKTVKYSIIDLFAVFVLGAYLLALFKDRLPYGRVEQLRRLGWLLVGIAFLLIGLGMLMLTFHQLDEGVATRISRDGSRVSASFSSEPMMFVFIVAFEIFFSGFFAFIGFGYLKLFRSMGDP
ncbi:hypothetical protein [Dyella jiangningensis]|uniref:Uncharacterized protein n=1 Tax=Dyella jiangningensis TaxID=1379159 RepID=A0A328NXV9_9GAMM|nr:hypothetical protein [Dyella jiangningensis]RAO75027.1 hypothetical protein CA260_12985 [Dyella jiangningensis]